MIQKPKSPGLSSHWWWGYWWPMLPPFECQSPPVENQAVTNMYNHSILSGNTQPPTHCIFGTISLVSYPTERIRFRMHTVVWAVWGEELYLEPLLRCAQTLASWWMIIGINPASITAWTCCWFPAVMLDKNQTASCKQPVKNSHNNIQNLSTHIIFYRCF